MIQLGVMLEQQDGSPPDGAALNRWVADFGLTHPVVADVGSSLSPFLNGGFPTYPVLDRDMTIVTGDNFPFDAALPLGLAGL